MKSKTSITASIDLTDDFEVSLLKHVMSKSNKSQYLKRLIFMDMTVTKERVITTHEEPEENDKEAMLSFI